MLTQTPQRSCRFSLLRIILFFLGGSCYWLIMIADSLLQLIFTDVFKEIMFSCFYKSEKVGSRLSGAFAFEKEMRGSVVFRKWVIKQVALRKKNFWFTGEGHYSQLFHRNHLESRRKMKLYMIQVNPKSDGLKSILIWTNRSTWLKNPC